MKYEVKRAQKEKIGKNGRWVVKVVKAMTFEINVAELVMKATVKVVKCTSEVSKLLNNVNCNRF